jgi:hypothetical protein
MLGTLFRFLILRVLGGRAAAVLAIVGVILGWRGRRAERRQVYRTQPGASGNRASRASETELERGRHAARRSEARSDRPSV